MCLTKKELRKVALVNRMELTKDEVISKSRVIHNKIEKEINLDCRLGLYMPIKNEVDLTMLLNKKVALPKIIDEMSLYRFNGDFERGMYDILEPTGEEMEVDIIFIPGSVYDKNGYRIGYGKGYYDKYLMNRDIVKIGVCFDFQVVDNIPKEDHDVRLDLLITDKKIYRW
ncbi:5-formyltetrahydrofolate cyclo-ligase [Mycoplasmatota bacterium]|nr:5-formyltetrahydrofolate cyclo-ligase [Mycoplasmatota bacterium]